MRYRYSRNAKGRLEQSAKIWTADEHKINKADVDPLAVHICERLNNEGFETYIVGGAVRDLLLSKTPKDFDIASAATPSRIKRLFRNSRIIGKRFRLVHVFFGEKIFEIATFRALNDDTNVMGTAGNTFGSIEEDARRRDFTMNALFYDPAQELVLDFVDGIKDIRCKRIRPLIPLSTIFDEDPVRMIRAVKYSVTTGFELPFFLKKKIKSTASQLHHISPSRLTEELGKIIKSPYSCDIIRELDALGLYVYMQPKASELMKASPKFRTRYLKTFASVNAQNDKNTNELAAGIRALIADYIDDNTDWENSGESHYKTAYLLARKFVLPINPPRIELARALRDHFELHGITVSRWRCYDRFSRGA